MIIGQCGHIDMTQESSNTCSPRSGWARQWVVLFRIIASQSSMAKTKTTICRCKFWLSAKMVLMVRSNPRMEPRQFFAMAVLSATETFVQSAANVWCR